MSPLDTKLLRDLGRMKGQVIAVGLVMSCGLAMMIMARSLILSLESTRAAYYTSHRFADLFSELKRAPNSLRARLREIPGVSAVETRVKGAAVLDLPGMQEPAEGAFLSLPEDRPQQLNLLYLRTGRLPAAGSHREVVLGEAFAKEHGFGPGDTIDATLYGARETFRIVGIGLSPEFVYESPPGNPLPDNKRFGVFWMNERELAEALNMDGAFNNVIVDAAPGADQRAIMADMDRLLEPYGGLVSYDRSEHASAMQLNDELRVLNGLSVAFPLVFLSIAAFMSSAVTSRLVRLQREQIAQLKALGYTSAEVGFHYLKFSLVIVVIATVVGASLGSWLGVNVVNLYQRFFRFPVLAFHPDFGAFAIALLASAGSSLLGVIGSVMQAVRLPPAEAMRPEPPADFKPSILERLGVAQLASPSFRMALRNLERKPWQAFFTALGLAFAAGIPIVPGAMRDGIQYLMDFQWSAAQRQDATANFIEPASYTALSDVAHLPGVIRAEPFRAVASRLRFGHHEHRVSVTGLPPHADLNRLLDADAQPVVLPPTGLLLSEKLAEMLGVRTGDIVRVEVQEGRRPILETVVSGTITDYAGVGAYMEIDALRRLMKEGKTISGVHVSVDQARWADFLAAVKEAPRIGSLAITSASRESFHKSTGEMIGTIQMIYFSFAVIVSFGVVYNSARIALSERNRDLATLRVIGFSHGEVAMVLISELAMLTLIAIPPGLWIGSQLATLIVATASTESVRMPLILSPRSFATATLIVLLSSGLSFALVARRIKNLDLLGVLKARD
jgi:putative ABC transport system permease protein